jgi:putative FmdB family regulatory protein
MAVIPATVADAALVPSFHYPHTIDFRLYSGQGRLSAMPIYEYELCEGGCKVCGGKFTLMRPVSAAPLTLCPACKKPVRKVLSAFSSPQKLKPLSVTDAKKAGFTVLKKSSKGEYERQ